MARVKTFWGFVLLIVGAFFLADNLGILSFSVGLLWPVLLILFGIFVIFGSRSDADSGESQTVNLPLDGAKRATVHIEHGAGRLRLRGATQAGELMSGEFYYLDYSTRKSGDSVDLRLKTDIANQFFFMLPWNWSGSRHEWDFALNPDIPLSLDLDTGASETFLDLRGLKVELLDLDTGASSTEIILPAAAGHTRVDVDSGAASVDITIPEGVAADIRIDSGLGSVSVDENRFPGRGGRYVSEDYAGAANRADIKISTGVSSVTIR